MRQSSHNPQSEAANPVYAMMLAKILIVATEDFAALGMQELSKQLREGIKEIMDKHQLKPEDVRVPRRISLLHPVTSR